METDLLQIKIEVAKKNLAEDTLSAINSVDWKAVINEMVNKRGFSIEQLGTLEMETELLLCGLVTPANYPRELQGGMGINKSQLDELLKEMDEKVFRKIKEKLIEITERKKFAYSQENSAAKPADASALKDAGIKIIPTPEPRTETAPLTVAREELLKKIEKPEPAPEISTEPHPIVMQKLSGPMQMPNKETVHTVDSLTKTAPAAKSQPEKPVSAANYAVDPYRETPE
jgi:hypothetical protein